MRASSTFHRVRAARGFTIIELIMCIAIVGVVLSIVVPRLRVTPTTEVQLAGMQLAQDLDFARTRALSTRSVVRTQFNNVASPNYVSFLDHDGNGTIAGTTTERTAMQGFGQRPLPARVLYGRGTAPPYPGDAGSGAITFASSRVEFDPRGLVVPFGTSGAVYLRHAEKPQEVVAVMLTGAGSVRMWVYHDGAWK